jgi:hypothetical protein
VLAVTAVVLLSWWTAAVAATALGGLGAGVCAEQRVSKVKVDDVPWKLKVDDVRREIDWRARITSEESHFLIYAVHTSRCAERSTTSIFAFHHMR